MPIECNIVELIETNPITKLSNNYQSKLIEKIKTKFTDNEQQLFVASFYCYLNYNKDDFVVDLDKIWKWLGFYQKDNAKHLLEKQFKLDYDYKYFAPDASGAKKKGSGGHNVKKIMLTIKTFKSFCLKACTKRADQIHEYFLKMEETLQEVINEDTNELRLQLQNKDLQLENIMESSQKDKELLREKTILEHFPENTQCVYYGLIDETTDKNEKLIKFGNSNFLSDRIDSHKKTFTNFRLVNAFKVENKFQIENAIKKHSVLSGIRRTLTINDKKQTELLAIDGMSFENIDRIIKDIIKSIEYSPENYNKLLIERDELYKQNLLLDEENKRLKIENIKLIKKYKLDKTIKTENTNNETVSEHEYYNVIKSMKRIDKSSDGFYYVNGNKYDKLFGSREQVWNGHAYKTTGGLTKTDLIINTDGKIVSKTKSVSEKQSGRLDAVNEKKKQPIM
jgi:regulator of replication initiation timing